MYEYYNPNLIRNQGLIKYVPKHYCDFPTSVTAFVQNDKNIKKNNNKDGYKKINTNTRK